MKFPAHLACLALALAVCIVPLSAQTFSVLYTFSGDPHGTGPGQGLILDNHGNLFGTTYGLTIGAHPKHYGTVYKINSSGAYTLVTNFHGANGANPEVGRLAQDSAGNLYGVADTGGTLGNGAIYTINAKGKQTVLYSFTDGSDSANPRGTLVRDSKGNLFGTTFGGTGATFYGTVFKFDTTGKLTTLHDFQTGSGDGLEPDGGLVADTHGNLYGTTVSGGSATPAVGTVYKISKSGKEKILHSFSGQPDGDTPYGDLLVDSVGNLYGITFYGGADNFGTIFKIDPKGNETILHSFAGAVHGDGAQPYGYLIRDAAGNFYGTTWTGGTSNLRTIYKMDSSGNVTILYNFSTGSIGSPGTGLVMDASGNLYGTTDANQQSGGFGTVFKLVP